MNTMITDFSLQVDFVVKGVRAGAKFAYVSLHIPLRWKKYMYRI
jgi:hypothetical protein